MLRLVFNHDAPDEDVDRTDGKSHLAVCWLGDRQPWMIVLPIWLQLRLTSTALCYRLELVYFGILLISEPTGKPFMTLPTLRPGSINPARHSQNESAGDEY